MNLTESAEMLKVAEQTGAVKIMIPVSELKFMLQQSAKVEEMQKALEWYADKENYKRSKNDVQTGYPHEIMWDKGIKARQVLKHLGLTAEGIEE